MDSSVIEIEHLVNLFKNQKQESSDSEDDQQNFPQGPESNKEKKKPKKVNPYAKIEPKPQPKQTTDPEELTEELLEQETENHKTDWKTTPKWDITYRQQVTASDVFLQIGFKTPSTSSCENMIVTIDLPGENQKNMDLKILHQSLSLSTPKFFLDIPLPHPVDPQQGNAQFDKDKEQLIITLKLDRELDFVNF